MFRFYGLLKVKLNSSCCFFRLTVLFNMVAIIGVCICTKSYFYDHALSFVNVGKNNASMFNSLITNLTLRR